MKDEKRAPRSYKVRQTPYVKASKRAKREQTTLAEKVEEWVTAYGNGYDVISYSVTYTDVYSNPTIFTPKKRSSKK